MNAEMLAVKYLGISLIFLIVGIVLSIVNIFIDSGSVSIFIDWLIVAIFCGFTIYDMNKLKLMAESGEFPEEKVAIYCALELYLDFINLFICFSVFLSCPCQYRYSFHASSVNFNSLIRHSLQLLHRLYNNLSLFQLLL